MRLSEVGKALTPDERADLVRRKQRARRISQVGGTLGLAALAARSPQLARATVGKVPRAAGNRQVGRLIAAEPRATSASNTLGIVSIGTGSAGSFNYAGLQRVEAKDQNRVRKASLSRVRVLESQAAALKADPLERWLRYAESSKRIPKAESDARRAQKAVRRVQKRDDKFLRTHRNRISTDAERGYQYLRRGRNKQAVVGTARGAIAGGDVASAYWFARKGHPVLAGAVGAAGAANAVLGVRDIRGASRWNAKMDKIKARAYQRARDGQYGRDRNTDVAKAVLRPRMAYGARVGGLVRRGTKTFTRRGSIQGSIQRRKRF